MTRKEIVELVDAVLVWQQTGYAHPLTCGNNSLHIDLLPRLTDDKQAVILACIECDYTQQLWPAVQTMLLKNRESKLNHKTFSKDN